MVASEEMQAPSPDPGADSDSGIRLTTASQAEAWGGDSGGAI